MTATRAPHRIDPRLGFTFAAMPGFIVRAVPVTETGSAIGFYQVMRSIGLSVGSAIAAAILMAGTPAGQILPRFEGFQVTLLVASSVGVLAAVVSYLLSGTSTERSLPVTTGVEQMMEEEAKLGGTSLSLAREPFVSEPEVPTR